MSEKTLDHFWNIMGLSLELFSETKRNWTTVILDTEIRK